MVNKWTTMAHAWGQSMWSGRKPCDLCMAEHYFCTRCGCDVIDHKCCCARLGFHGASPWAVKRKWPRVRVFEFDGERYVDFVVEDSTVFTSYLDAVEYQQNYEDAQT